MVSLRTTIISEVRRSLQVYIDNGKLSSLQAGFLAWLNRSNYSPLFEDYNIEAQVELDYTALAYLGYAGETAQDIKVAETFARGCERFVGRPIKRTSGDLQSFALDPVALLGILIGARRISGSLGAMVSKYVRDVLNSSLLILAGDGLKAAFARVCLEETGVNLIDETVANPAVVYALFRRTGRTVPSSIIEPAFIEVQLSAGHHLDAFESELMLYAYNGLLAQTTELNINKPTVEQILSILDSVGAGLFRWPYGQNKTQVWEVENEYDVQAMLYFLLKPYLPELKEEETVRSIGRKRPRIDLIVQSLQLAIEVKFMRQNGKFSDILGEVAEDKSFYLGSGSVYSRMIVFLWDDSSRTEEHATFKQGVIDLGLDGVVIVNRPSFMKREIHGRPVQKVSDTGLPKGKGKP